MRRIGNLPVRAGVVRVRGTFGLGLAVHYRMRVLDVNVGPWVLTVEGPQ